LTAVPLPAAARELRVSVPTLRRWIRAGAPQARRGRRGRGGRALVDPAAIVAWRRFGKACDDAALVVLASELPELVAAAVWQSFVNVEGMRKAPVAGVLAGCWYVVTVALLDRLRRDVPELCDPDVVPRQIDHLRSIYAGLCTVGSRTLDPP
jgi:hypothetical protein